MAKRSKNYGDACATVRSEIRLAIAETARITGLRADHNSEALVEAMFAKIAGAGAVKWAFYEVLNAER